MAEAWTEGFWTYRSYYNDKPETTNDVLLARAELVFEPAGSGQARGQLAWRSDPPTSCDPRMVLTGSHEVGTPSTIRFRGVGLEETGAKGWVYDYVGYLVPSWVNGQAQTDAIIGSVIRVADHPGDDGIIHEAGEVFSFIARIP